MSYFDSSGNCVTCNGEEPTECNCDEVTALVDDDETNDSYWLICPHCAHRHDTTEINNHHAEVMDCERCGKAFEHWVYVSYTYYGSVKKEDDRVSSGNPNS